MKGMVEEAMQAGAIGVSTALIYPPAVYASEEEITALTAVAGQYGGRYFTHMRNEGDRLLDAIDEALRIGRNAHTPVHIFHLKAAGQANWGKMDLALARIRQARAGGQDVAVDVYPYINNGLDIRALRVIVRREARRRRGEVTPVARAHSSAVATGIVLEDVEPHRARHWARVVLDGCAVGRARSLALCGGHAGRLSAL